MIPLHMNPQVPTHARPAKMPGKGTSARQSAAMGLPDDHFYTPIFGVGHIIGCLNQGVFFSMG